MKVEWVIITEKKKIANTLRINRKFQAKGKAVKRARENLKLKGMQHLISSIESESYLYFMSLMYLKLSNLNS